MITFDDVRKTTETTFFFFPDGMHDMLAHFLTLAGFSEEQDFRILSCAETRREYPGLHVPMVPNHPSLAGNPCAYDKPLTMISRMDVNDLERKLWEIDESDEAMAWEVQCVKELLAEGRTRTERLKGWLPGLKRESEDAR